MKLLDYLSNRRWKPGLAFAFGPIAAYHQFYEKNRQIFWNRERIPKVVHSQASPSLPMEYKDSTTTTISDILPTKGKRFRFQYEYDFGDSWNHEILFEGIVQADPKAKYPLCLEGERACPPEDCGGVWGYGDFVEAIQNPDHERHEELVKWVGGKFDPEKFDAAKATKAMRKGLPDWRKMAGW